MKSFGDILWCEERRESTYWSNPQSTPAEDSELLEEPQECEEYRRKPNITGQKSREKCGSIFVVCVSYLIIKSLT